MMDEFGIDDLDGLSDFIMDASRKATRDAIAKVPAGTYRNDMRVDGFEAAVDMVVTLTVDGERLVADFDGTSGMSAFGVNVPEVYTRAYACYALKCAIAPEVPNNTGSLAPFEITAPEGCILAAKRPAPVSVRHVLGHLVPDVVLGALHKALPDLAPADGLGLADNIRESLTFLGVILVANGAALILYVTPFAPFVFYGLNGFLLGREYFRMVALRRLSREEANAAFRRNLPAIWSAGALMAIPLTVPLLNLLIPILGAATFTHIFHKAAR